MCVDDPTWCTSSGEAARREKIHPQMMVCDEIQICAETYYFSNQSPKDKSVRRDQGEEEEARRDFFWGGEVTKHATVATVPNEKVAQKETCLQTIVPVDSTIAPRP